MSDTLTAGEVGGHLDVGAAGEEVVLPISALNVDAEYQRDIRRAFVNEIAQNFDLVKAQSAVVGQRPDGSYWVIDGQHRIMGGMQAGETEFICRVVPSTGRAYEADIRLALNNRKADTTFERFHARVVAEEPTALALMELCKRFHTAINVTPNQKTGLNAIAAVEALYNRDDGVTLTRVFEVIERAWGNVGGEAAGAAPLKAIPWFLEKHVDRGEAKLPRFIDRIEAVGVDELRRKAAAHKAAMGGSQWLNFYRAMVEVYNHKLPEASKLMWRTSGSGQVGDYGGEGSARHLQSRADVAPEGIAR